MSHLPAGILPTDVDVKAIDELSARYALGVPDIDEQHRLLFGWCVALRTAREVLPTASALAAYAARHFLDEENWALEREVDIAAHQAQHLELLRNLDDFLRRPRISRMELQAMAFDWLTVHIDVDDRSLVRAARAP